MTNARLLGASIIGAIVGVGGVIGLCSRRSPDEKKSADDDGCAAQKAFDIKDVWGHNITVAIKPDTSYEQHIYRMSGRRVLNAAVLQAIMTNITVVKTSAPHIVHTNTVSAYLLPNHGIVIEIHAPQIEDENDVACGTSIFTGYIPFVRFMEKQHKEINAFIRPHWDMMGMAVQSLSEIGLFMGRECLMDIQESMEEALIAFMATYEPEDQVRRMFPKTREDRDRARRAEDLLRQAAGR